VPIFEFQCTKCRHLFEEFFAKLPERPSAKCPECGGKGKKLISNVGIVFKGAGFYVTDSRTSPAKGSSASSTTSKPDTAPSPDTVTASDNSSSESASEGKSEPKSDTGSEKKGKSKPKDSGKSSGGSDD